MLDTPRPVAVRVPLLEPSTEPAVVFSSLVHESVPGYCDACIVDLVEHEHAAYRIGYPLRDAQDAETGAGPGARISTPFYSRPDGGLPYAGALVLTWHSRSYTKADVTVAQWLADRAVATITEQRLAATTREAADKVANLESALQSSRRIGMAIGVLMASREVSSEDALALLRSASQHTHRKVRDIADEVLAVGRLDD